MPIVKAQGKTIECQPRVNLLQVSLENGIEGCNEAAGLINCRKLGTCGTCAVEISGAIAAPRWPEQARSLPPHSPRLHRRLACQIPVTADLEVTKYNGFWGQGDQPVWTPTQEKR